MKEIGIVRRIDDLGRLVIPKEIRKKYHLQEGDEVEIYTHAEQIIIKKYYAFSKQYNELVKMCEILNDFIKEEVFFVIEEDIIQNNIKLSQSFRHLCKQYHHIHFHDEMIREDGDLSNGWIVPVVIEGHWYGAFVIVEKKHQISQEQLKFIELFVQFISRQ